MKMQSSLSPQLQQKMKLSPQIIQSIEILQLPLLALMEQVQQELVDNPVLEEVVEDKKAEDEEDAVQITESNPDNNEFDRWSEIAEDWREYYSQTTSKWNNTSDERDQKQEALENTADKHMSLYDYLLGQLSLVDVPDRLVEACENIIYSIDESGYLGCSLEDIIQSLEKPISLDECREALTVVQSMEPPGIAARNLKECLLLQLDKRDANYPLMKTLILNHLEDIEARKYVFIAKKTGYSLDVIKKQIELIRTLNPKPGSVFCEEVVPYVVPEVKVEYIDGKYEVFLVDNLPHLCISPFYKKFLGEKGNNNQIRQYIQKKIESAKWLVDAIEQRRNTLYKVACKIVELQKDFLDEGVHRLRTLKMQDIADIIGVHVSTVSRAIAHKYIQTPQGIFELKYFFTGGFKNENGSMESWEAIRQKLSEIIANENKSNPLSDEEVAEKFRASGLDIARRTVTKYRRIMKIPSSRQRRKI